MEKGAQEPIQELDLSERLRQVMREHDLTVAQIAAVAGVSKSAMEKYLAGPSSPRATAIASICYRLGVDADWLLLGVPSNDFRIVRFAVMSAIRDLVNELKQGTDLSEKFYELQFGKEEWRRFVTELSDERAVEAVGRIIEDRRKEQKDNLDGLRVAIVGPYSIYGNEK